MGEWMGVEGSEMERERKVLKLEIESRHLV